VVDPVRGDPADERHVDRHETDGVRNIVGRQHPRVDPFTDDDARIVSEAPVQLAAPDIKCDDAGGPALEEDIGEAACGRPHIERASSGRIDTERVERASEFESAAPDIRMIRYGELDTRIALDRRARFRDDLTVDGHLPGQDQRARALPRRSQSEIDERDIQTGLGIGRGHGI